MTTDHSLAEIQPVRPKRSWGWLIYLGAALVIVGAIAWATLNEITRNPARVIGQMALSEALLLHYNCLVRILTLVSPKDSTIANAHATRHSQTWQGCHARSRLAPSTGGGQSLLP